MDIPFYGEKQNSSQETNCYFQLVDSLKKRIERRVAYLLGPLDPELSNRLLNETDFKHAGKMYFVINNDNGLKLRFRSDASARQINVTSGGESLTMIVRISGDRDARVQPPIMIFKNKGSNSIRGLPDDIPDACYCTGPKGWVLKLKGVKSVN